MTFWRNSNKIPDINQETEWSDPLMQSMKATSLWVELKAAWDRGLLTEDERDRSAVKICELNPGHVKKLYDEGLISLELSKPYVLKVLEDDPRKVIDFFDSGMVNREEARVYALRACQIGND